MAGKPGHGGKKGLSGRKPKLSTQVRRALESVPVKDIFDKLIEMGLEGDREACIYLLDRIYGKPKQTQDINLTDDVALSLQIHRILTQVEPLQLAGSSAGGQLAAGQGEDGIQNQNETEDQSSEG